MLYLPLLFAILSKANANIANVSTTTGNAISANMSTANDSINFTNIGLTNA